ncbi:MAG: hypothetical protein QM705_11380 [Ancrocorticia sp.]
MTIWRPVIGEIIRFDRSLATIESFEEYFAANRIIARGYDRGDSYDFELAVRGRRKRVACLDDDGAVVPGPNLADLVETMGKDLRKVQIEIDGHVAWGNIDLGEVDVTWDDVEEVETAESAEEEGGFESGGEKIEGEQFPEVREGSMLLISDLSFAELPGYAAQTGSPIAAFELGKAKAILADVPLPRRKAYVSPLFVIMLSMDPSGLEPPVLAIRQDGNRVVWRWDYQLSDVPWVAENEAAAEFAYEQLGAGAVVTRMCADLPEANGELLRAVLVGEPAAVGRDMAVALGLPAEVGDSLDGLLEARLIPGAVVFEPKSFTERIQTTVAYEVAGRGRAKPSFWKLYRKLYLEHPLVMEGVASAQAGLGVLMLASGVRTWNKPSGKLLAGIGGALAVNSGTRIIATQWVQAALEYEGLAPRLQSAVSAVSAASAGSAGSAASAGSATSAAAE